MIQSTLLSPESAAHVSFMELIVRFSSLFRCLTVTLLFWFTLTTVIVLILALAGERSVAFLLLKNHVFPSSVDRDQMNDTVA